MARRTITFEIESVSLDDVERLEIYRKGTDVMLQVKYQVLRADGSVYRQGSHQVALSAERKGQLADFLRTTILQDINQAEGF